MRLIDADALIETLYNSLGCDRAYYDEKCDIDFDFVIQTINSQKTVESRPKGKWIPVTNGRGGHECNNCHNYAPSLQTGEERLTDFCPYCGADMNKGETHD